MHNGAMPTALTLRPAEPADEAVWRRLWQGYCDFYEARVPEAVTALTWARICDPAASVHAVLAERAGAVVGFANYVLHEGTWETQPLCYLEDLFVAPEARGLGAGAALLQWLREQMTARGWSRLYWMTRRDNAAARRLYDRFVPADDFVRYLVRRDAAAG
jgi:GNAT superfamily N-acetyltransferase